MYTVKWFEVFGIKIKMDPDDRIFPSTNSSETIIDFLLKKAENRSIEIIKQKTICRLQK